MKHVMLMLVISMLMSQLLPAQDSLVRRQVIFKVNVFDSLSIKRSGYLAALNDSVLFITKGLFSSSFLNLSDHALQKFGYQNLEQVDLVRTGSNGRGALYGTICGILIGAVAGFVSGDDPEGFFSLSAGDKALLYGAIGAGGGAIIGGIIGAVAHKTFIIGGRKDQFRRMKVALGDRPFR
ncbi:MAG: hypothetical protein Q8918_07460 [Bacteroidota bacterium]|nr:hypothetical protein [Bacteroidota bacterium]MDP4211997.1 hypothetical protein [Bacteroidota bacterium]MDP4249933.1 hypothetical protein [Bacteroidota bacterium]